MTTWKFPHNPGLRWVIYVIYLHLLQSSSGHFEWAKLVCRFSRVHMTWQQQLKTVLCEQGSGFLTCLYPCTGSSMGGQILPDGAAHTMVASNFLWFPFLQWKHKIRTLKHAKLGLWHQNLLLTTWISNYIITPYILVFNAKVFKLHYFFLLSKCSRYLL